MTEPATPAAAEPAVPAATEPAAPATPVVKNEPASLLDSGDPNAPATPPATEPAAPAADDAKWYLAEGVAANGEPPEWFKADKYKTVDEQAKAYTELEKRFGAFTGAPKDGEYKINPPEGIQVEFDTDHELFKELNTWAKDANVSQAAYDQIIGMFSRYEASLVPDMAALKKDLGDDADSRLNSVNQWAKTNLTEEQYQVFRASQTQSNAADVFKAFEAVINKTRQPALPKVDDDVPSSGSDTLDQINAMQAKKNEKGERLYVIDPKYREDVERRRREYFQSLEK